MKIISTQSKRLLIILFGLVTFIVLNAPKTYADTYNVSASVPYDPPTVAATVVTPATNTTVSTDNVDIIGTCQVLNPPTIISVWNGSTLLGSTSCQVGGNYSINVALYTGVNILNIRSSNINALYGPDSAPFTITYTPQGAPVVIVPAPSGTPIMMQSKPANNPQTSRELFMTSTTPFGVTDDNNSVSIDITVKGGGEPYTLQINWGDGTTESQQISLAGDYKFTHVFEKPGIYHVLATLTDVLGRSRTFSWIVTSRQLPANQSTGAATLSQDPGKSANYSLYLYIALFIFFIFMFVLVFLFGRYYQTIESRRLIAKNRVKKRKASA